LKNRNVSESFEELVRGEVEGLGYDLVGTEIVREHERKILRIYIDSLGGVMLKDCENVSRAVNKLLELKDDLEPEEKYYLEVSSPGIERPLFSLKDFEKFKGRLVSIKTRKSYPGKRKFKAIIVSTENNSVTLETEKEGTFSVGLEDIVKANLVWEGSEKKR
jgi:ribosome maturation factor RimP